MYYQLQQQMQKRDQTTKFKILLIGPSGVGKTSLLIKYIQNQFSYDYQVTTGIQFFTKNVQINQKTSVNLQIWDTMGQQAFKSVVKTHYRGVAAVIFIYSIQKHQSIDKLSIWVKQVKDNVHEQTLFFLVGTKLDLEDVRKVPKQQGQSYGKNIKAVFFQQISAKTGQNIKELFDKLSKALYKKFQSSKSYKQLVKPIISSGNGYQKSESFQLKKLDGIRNKQKDTSCC